MLYNVYIVKSENNKAESKIGNNLSERKVETRIMTGLTRINENYFIADCEVGDKDDLKYSADLLIK